MATDVARIARDIGERAGGHWLSITLVLALGAGALALHALVVKPRMYRRAAQRWPARPLRFSLPGLWSLLLPVLLAWLTGMLVTRALFWGDAGDTGRTGAAVQLVVALGVLVVFVTSLGSATLAMAGSAANGAAAPWGKGLRAAPLAMALMLASIALAERITVWTHPGAAVMQALQWGIALLFAVVFGLILARITAALAGAERANTVSARRVVHAVKAGVAIGWVAVIICVLALPLGRGDFAASLAKQVAWSVLVLMLFHLVWRVVRDVTDAMLDNEARVRRWSLRLGVAGTRVRQAVILAGGVCQLAAGMFALVLLTAPYGLGPDDLFGRVLGRQGELHIGTLVFSPSQILKAFVVLTVTLVVARVVRHWLSCRWFPTTKLDAGMQSSLSSMAGYAGIIVAISLCLAALGIGLDKIAWIASALTVGIGFGLQAIVQNFVSGLILLAERPIKVGDWVVVGDAEGDVRRINVRATEIAMADRTTLLVPNSEFITKAVRNRTFSASDGVLKILLPLPATTDVNRAVELLRATVDQQAGVLRRPAPIVQVEDVKDNKIWMGVSAHVDGPREVARIRAELLFAVLRDLQAEGIPLV